MKKNNLKYISKQNISPEGGRKCWNFYHYLIVKQYTIAHKNWDLRKYSVIAHHKDNTAYWFFANDQKLWRENLGKYLKNPSLHKKLEQYITKTSKSGIKHIETALKECDDKKIANTFSQFSDNLMLLLISASILRFWDRAVSLHFRESNEYSNSDEILRVVSIPFRESFAVQEERVLASVALECVKKNLRTDNKNVISKIKDINNNFNFCTLGYYKEKAKSVEEYTVRLKEMISSGPKEIIDLLNKRNTEEILEWKKLTKTMSSKDFLVAKLASEIPYIKDYYKFCMNKFISHAEPLFAKVADVLGTSRDSVKDMWPEHIIALLKNKTIAPSLVKEISKQNIIVAEKGKFYTFIGKAADDFFKTYLKNENQNNTEIKGRVASKGYVRGEAMVIRGSEQFHKMKDGAILIVINTSPDYVSIMRRAKGIVAEEGGLTSHVSIVSREFKLPCIVGVRDATKIIKDGDLVEVNADTGIVTILKKAN